NSYQVDLPADLKRRGIHNTFHASLLRKHHANDDRLFPNRSLTKILEDNDEQKEWEVDKVITHAGTRENATFHVRWKTG
ncbi:hypothetical protein M378DRAFT_49282, partial [Amanita muscaria Koide BX008]